MRIFRLHRARRSAADYTGSLLYPGRWHPAGTPMLYFSVALSLACLEQLVHLASDELPDGYAYTSLELDAEPVLADYRGSLADLDSTRRFGHRWVNEGQTVAMRVPSAVIPIEFNVLINPLHPDFERHDWSAPQPFGFDARLLKS